MQTLSFWLLVSVLSVSFLSSLAMAFKAWSEEPARPQTHILPVFSIVGTGAKEGTSNALSEDSAGGIAPVHVAEAIVSPVEGGAGVPSGNVAAAGEAEPDPEVRADDRVMEMKERFESVLLNMLEAPSPVRSGVGDRVETERAPVVAQPARRAVPDPSHDEQAEERKPVSPPLHEPSVRPVSAPVVLSSSRPMQEIALAQSYAGAMRAPEEDVARLGVMVFEDEVLLLMNADRLSARRQNLILQRLMLQPEPPTEDRLLSQTRIRLKGKKPWFYGRILTPNGEPVRFARQARELATSLLRQAERVREEDGTVWLRVRVPLRDPKAREKKRQAERDGETSRSRVEARWRKAQSALARHVIAQARQYGVSPALVMGIIEVESAFHPQAVSATGALGLMQIRPQDAGRDIEKLLNRSFSRGDFFNPYINVEIGTAYLSLLKSEYLAGVRDARSREYLAIAAYNGGINRVLKHFGPTPAQAVARINRMKPQAVYRALRYRFPYRETRRYLEKVVRAKKRYQEQLDAHAT